MEILSLDCHHNSYNNSLICLSYNLFYCCKISFFLFQSIKIGLKQHLNKKNITQYGEKYEMSKVMRFSREYKPTSTVVNVNKTKVGGKFFAIAAGPCAIENPEQYIETAKIVKKAGANIIRGSVFKPRTSPYSFQGLGREGLKLIKDLGEDLDIATVTEVMDPRDIKITANHVDIIQIGARNMQNYDLLKEASKSCCWLYVAASPTNAFRFLGCFLTITR